jgi:spermidine/putrescine transport system permease protein
MAIAMLMLFSTLHLSLGFLTLLISHITLCVPFVAVVINSRLSTLDKNLYEAARDLGASERVIIYRIILPLVKSAILSAWLLSFSLSFDDIIISYFVTGPTYTILPLSIFSMVRLGVKPEVNALCTLVFGITFFLILMAYRLLPQNNRR